MSEKIDALFQKVVERHGLDDPDVQIVYEKKGTTTVYHNRESNIITKVSTGWARWKDFKTEIKLQIRLSRHGLAPNIRSWGNYDKLVGWIVMEAGIMDLSRFLDGASTQLQRCVTESVVKLLWKVAEQDILLLDVKLPNFVLWSPKGEVRAIDCGSTWASREPPGDSRLLWISMVFLFWLFATRMDAVKLIPRCRLPSAVKWKNEEERDAVYDLLTKHQAESLVEAYCEKGMTLQLGMQQYESRLEDNFA